MAVLQRAIARAWTRSGLSGRVLHALLRPPSVLFAAAARLRVLGYRLPFRCRRVAAAVVSVGNLSVGGTGKTPTVLWLSEGLRARGYRVAIVSRGYGGDARRVTRVAGAGVETIDGLAASDDVRVVGDENLMLARRFAGPVIAGTRRAAAADLAVRALGADVVVLDDGFQHLALRRDFDLVCVRVGVPGDDAVLPAGRLREPPSALRRADAVLITKSDSGATLPAHLAPHARGPVHRGRLRAVALVTPDGGVLREVPMGMLAARRSLGIAGLADPEPFYRTLHEWEARLEDFLEFPDHHDYTLEDWKKIAYRSRELDLVVTTEKDLVKLDKFPFAKDKLVAVRVVMEVDDGERLLDAVTAAVERRRAELATGGGAAGR